MRRPKPSSLRNILIVFACFVVLHIATSRSLTSRECRFCTHVDNEPQSVAKSLELTENTEHLATRRVDVAHHCTCKFHSELFRFRQDVALKRLPHGHSWRCRGADLMISSTRRIISAASVADNSTAFFTLKASKMPSCSISPRQPRITSIPDRPPMPSE